MIDLGPCNGCRRHIDVRERVCPFCGVFGRLARAAGIAGIALATACGGTTPKPEPRPAVTVDAGVDAGEAGADARVEEAIDRTDPREEHFHERRRHRGSNGNAKMPYGAPPRGRRIV